MRSVVKVGSIAWHGSKATPASVGAPVQVGSPALCSTSSAASGFSANGARLRLRATWLSGAWLSRKRAGARAPAASATADEMRRVKNSNSSRSKPMLARPRGCRADSTRSSRVRDACAWPRARAASGRCHATRGAHAGARSPRRPDHRGCSTDPRPPTPAARRVRLRCRSLAPTVGPDRVAGPALERVAAQRHARHRCDVDLRRAGSKRSGARLRLRGRVGRWSSTAEQQRER